MGDVASLGSPADGWWRTAATAAVERVPPLPVVRVNRAASTLHGGDDQAAKLHAALQRLVEIAGVRVVLLRVLLLRVLLRVGRAGRRALLLVLLRVGRRRVGGRRWLEAVARAGVGSGGAGRRAGRVGEGGGDGRETEGLSVRGHGRFCTRIPWEVRIREKL